MICGQQRQGESRRCGEGGGRLGKAQAERDRLQKNHEGLQRLIKQQAATQDELAANDLALTKAQAEVTRLAAAKQEFDRSVKLDADQAALHVQQIENEVAAFDERCGKGESPRRRMEHCTRCQ